MIRRAIWFFAATVLVVVPVIILASDAAAATVLRWTFDDLDLSVDYAYAGTGSMTYKDAATQAATSFGSTDPYPPNPAGGYAIYLYHPQLPGNGEGGYQMHFDSGVLPNGGGVYVNQYTMIFDVFIPPSPNWTALFNTEPGNANDADWYVAPDGALGIGALGYSPAGTIQPDAWYRLGFVADLGAGVVKYWVNGNLVHTRTGGSLLDGRFSLYSSNDNLPGGHVNLHGEGDGSGNYTHAMYLNNFLFADYPIDDETMQRLGGVTAGPIAVPEPSAAGLLVCMGVAGAVGAVRRRRHNGSMRATGAGREEATAYASNSFPKCLPGQVSRQFRA